METFELVLVIEPCLCPAFNTKVSSMKSDCSFLPNKSGLLTSSAIRTQLTIKKSFYLNKIPSLRINIQNYTCTIC